MHLVIFSVFGVTLRRGKAVEGFHCVKELFPIFPGQLPDLSSHVLRGVFVENFTRCKKDFLREKSPAGVLGSRATQPEKTIQAGRGARGRLGLQLCDFHVIIDRTQSLIIDRTQSLHCVKKIKRMEVFLHESTT